MRKMWIYLAVIVFIVIGGGAFVPPVWQWLQPRGFSDADIDAVKTSIMTEFGKRDGITVSDVTMLRENPRKLTGFVKFRFTLHTPPTATCSDGTVVSGDHPNVDCINNGGVYELPAAYAKAIEDAYHLDMTKACSATMASGGEKYLWLCE